MQVLARPLKATKDAKQKADDYRDERAARGWIFQFGKYREHNCQPVDMLLRREDLVIPQPRKRH